MESVAGYRESKKDVDVVVVGKTGITGKGLGGVSDFCGDNGCTSPGDSHPFSHKKERLRKDPHLPQEYPQLYPKATRNFSVCTKLLANLCDVGLESRVFAKEFGNLLDSV